jgi:hypothetical protein
VSSGEITPAMQAEYDQAMAQSRELLERLVASFIVRRREDVEDDVPQSLTVMAMVRTLQDSWTHDHLLSALSAAVLLMVETLEPDLDAA